MEETVIKLIPPHNMRRRRCVTALSHDPGALLICSES